jgi:hypothetical protein
VSLEKSIRTLKYQISLGSRLPAPEFLRQGLTPNIGVGPNITVHFLFFFFQNNFSTLMIETIAEKQKWMPSVRLISLEKMASPLQPVSAHK